MDTLQYKTQSINGEVGRLSRALRGYLEEGIVLEDKKVQKPRPKGAQEFLEHFIDRLDLVAKEVVNYHDFVASHIHLPSPALSRPDTPLSYKSTITQRIPLAAGQPAQHAPLTNGTPSTAIQQRQALAGQAFQEIRLKDGSGYRSPMPSAHASPLFDCTYQDIHVLNEELFELYSSHPVVRDLGYFKLQVRELPALSVGKVRAPGKDHATSFNYKVHRNGLVKVDAGKKVKFTAPRLPFPTSSKTDWSLEEQRDLWNSSAADPPKGDRAYIIGNPLFDDVDLSPGEKLRRRGRARLEGINSQYVYFNLAGKTITTMHREDAHVRSENLLRSGEHKFWCFVKPAFSRKLEERLALEYPDMRCCSQAVRHLSLNIPPAKLDEWGIEYTLDYCVPGQAVVTEPGTYHQVLNLGPNYAVAINVEYHSSPDMPLGYRFCDGFCPDKFAISADDFRIYEKPPQWLEEQLPRTPETTGSQEEHATIPGSAVPARSESAVAQITQSATPPPEHVIPEVHEPARLLPTLSEGQTPEQSWPPRPEQDIPLATAAVPELLPPPVLQGNSAPSRLLEPVRLVSSLHPPEGSVPAKSYPAESSILSAQKPNKTEPSRPSEPLSNQICPLALVPRRDQAPPASISQDQEPNVSSQAHHPYHPIVTQRVQSLPCAPQIPQQHALHNQPGVSVEEVPPIRKTARMINRKRAPDTMAPNSTKRQRVEAPLTQPSPNCPVDGAFQHLSALLRGREIARTASLTVDKVSGKPAFERVSHLIREWRRYLKSAPAVRGGLDLAKAVEETLDAYPELHVFLSRFFKMQVASWLEEAMSKSGTIALPSFLDGMLRMLGWNETQRHTLHDYFREGKCWKAICGPYDGLLCLLPPDADCFDLALFQDELARFHLELDTEFVRRLCGIGSMLQRSIWQCLELPEFIWENMTTTWLSVEQIAPLLAPFRLLRSNYYEENSGYYWPRPAGWHWTWPIDPSSIKPGDRPCDLCSHRSCRCAEDRIPRIPRILDDKTRGHGIRSVGSHKANEILGELVGELVPPGASCGDWAMELRRPDLDDQVVADIYPRRMGNWVRKVNHSTDPSAVFRVMKISGRWRQILVAMRNIVDGEEITAKYGKGFLKGQPYSVVEGLL
ncbi:hypothetical protein VTI74DRAFT_4332 [Chaetomium olivicolor]